MDEITHTIMPDPIRVVFHRKPAGIYPPADKAGGMAGGECICRRDHRCQGQQIARLVQN